MKTRQFLSSLAAIVAVALPTAVLPSSAADVEGAAHPPDSVSEDPMYFGVADDSGYNIVRSAAGSEDVIAVLAVGGIEGPIWSGEMCVSGDGRAIFAIFAPTNFTNDPVLRQRGAFAAVVNTQTGHVEPLPYRVALNYQNPSCGKHDAVFTRYLGDDFVETTELMRVTRDGVTKKNVGLAGQISGAVPVGEAIIGARGNRVVKIGQEGQIDEVASEFGQVSRLRPDPNEIDVLYQVSTSDTAEVRRLEAGARSSALVASGPLGSVRPTPVYTTPALIGTQEATLHDNGQPIARVLDLSLGDVISSSGNRTGRLTYSDLDRDPSITLTVRSQQTAGASSGGSGTASDSRLLDIANSTTASTGTAGLEVGGGAANTTTPICAVPRNDPDLQVLQPSYAQVEWAVQRRVHGTLNLSRPANWHNNGLGSYTVAGLMPPTPLTTGGSIPAQVLLGILAQESNIWQASSHAVPGTAGNPLIGDYYGVVYGSGLVVSMDFDNADCGYGVGQVTDHMTTADPTWSAATKTAVATDYAVNVAASANILATKWNELDQADITLNAFGGPANPIGIENWYFALWAYNSGLHPFVGSGQPWGLGWTNNPANADYPPERQGFLRDSYGDSVTPWLWPYQELVLGWAEHAQVDSDGSPKYTATSTLLTLPGDPYFLCDASNECSEFYTDPNPAPPDQSFCTRSDRHCWWHLPTTYSPSSATPEVAISTTGTELPGADSTHPASCLPSDSAVPENPALAALPGTAIVVDDVPASTANLAGCGVVQSQGSFTVDLDVDGNGIDLADIDFHQIGAGYGGHFWFAHTNNPSRATHSVTGTWTPPTSVGGWQRIYVHVPDHGADTYQARYEIDTGGGSQFRTVNQRWNSNSWVELGVFDLTAGAATVSLSNNTRNDWWQSQTSPAQSTSSPDIAWDAVAFVPTTEPAASVVVMGDSFASGEGLEPYFDNSDYPETSSYNRTTKCHRSPQSWAAGLGESLGVTFPGQAVAFHSVACAGSVLDDLIDMPGQGGPSRGQHGEVPQLESGWIDESTTHVVVLIGGNDAGFADVLTACIISGNATVLNACLAEEYRVTRKIQDPVTGVVTEQVDEASLEDSENAIIDGLAGDYRHLISEIRERAPGARITFSGYPVLATLGRIGLDEVDCEVITHPDVLNFIETATDRMNSVILGAALERRASFADPVAEFIGHGACALGAGQEWINPVSSTVEFEWPPLSVADRSFHPTTTGHDHYQTVIASVLPTGAKPWVPPTTPTFSDVTPTHQFYTEIEWGAYTDLVAGYADGTFRPTPTVTRQAIAAYMYRYAKLTGVAGAASFVPPVSPSFTDVPTTNAFYKEIEWMKFAGITNGYADGTFRPTLKITRAAESAFMYRLAGQNDTSYTVPSVNTYSDVLVSHPFFAEIEWMAHANVTQGFANGEFRPDNQVSRQVIVTWMFNLYWNNPTL